MILQKLSYSQFTGTPSSWSLDGIVLENVNLLVGKNATGKTNTLTIIAWLGNMLAGLQPGLLNSGNYDVEFTHNNNVYQYKLNLLEFRVEHEELIIENDHKFERGNDGKGQIFTAQFLDKMEFQLSPNQLVVTSKRDAIQHPFLEELARWAEGQRMYNFSSDMGKYTIFPANYINDINVNPRDMNSVIGLYLKGDREFPNDFQECIINYMNEIGYELNNIKVVPTHNALSFIPYTGNINGLVLCVRENNCDAELPQSYMSQGMFRAFSLLIQITYNIMSGLPSTILIDDIGEGLDFERSTKLIRLLIELTKKNDDIQLIMSTNDRFVMNNVPLEYWQVIQRKGGECRVYNYRNSKKIFDEFAYTGLNNFDFLATDFLNIEN